MFPAGFSLRQTQAFKSTAPKVASTWRKYRTSCHRSMAATLMSRPVAPRFRKSSATLLRTRQQTKGGTTLPPRWHGEPAVKPGESESSAVRTSASVWAQPYAVRLPSDLEREKMRRPSATTSPTKICRALACIRLIALQIQKTSVTAGARGSRFESTGGNIPNADTRNRLTLFC